MKLHHILLSLGMLLLVQVSQAQISLNLALNPRPQPRLADWGNPINGVMVISFMQSTIQIDPAIKIKTTLLDQNGGTIGISNINAARVYMLKQGVNQFSIADALQLQNLILYGSARTLLQRTGRLAAGQYQLMVEITNTAGDVVRTNQSKPFFVTSYQLPVLMQPANGTALDAHIAQSVIVFRWTPLIPGYQELPTYRIQVFEILPGQTPMQAFRGNRPVLDDEAIKGATQLVWRPSLPMIDSTANRQFIWTVQTLDMNGIPIPTEDMNVQGRSEPAIFNIVNHIGAIDTHKKNESIIKQ
ncbi:MAG: hypothetical protein ABI367_00500 [Mucilaginibacter sp.]